MAKHIQNLWEPRFQGLTRRDRQGCDYDAYLPHALPPWNLTLPSDLAADIADAESAIRDLNQAGTSHVSLEGLARFLLRAESVASSKIEGLDAGPRRLVEAEATLAQGGKCTDRVAVEVLGNIAAMEAAIQVATQDQTISLPDLLKIHRVLMDRSPRPELGGVVREQQNWVGGSSSNPCSAVFVPPPAERVEGLLHDLIAYTNGEEHSPLVQAAIAHAQFETIHPFADGNGRTGRALIHIILRQRGLAPTFVPPISVILAREKEKYIEGLTLFREDRIPEWLGIFASAANRSAGLAITYAAQAAELQERWRQKLRAHSNPRADAAAWAIIEVLPGHPFITVPVAVAATKRTRPAVTNAAAELEAAGILRRISESPRSRTWEADGLVDLIAALDASAL